MKNAVIIGAGQIAEKVHVSYFKKRSSDIKIVAVVDPFIERAIEFAKRNNIPHYYETVEEMLKHENVDMASICTPNRFHFETAMILLDHGVAVFCEKPPAMTANQAKLMYKKAKEKGSFLAFDFQHRYSEETQQLKNQIEKLGDIYYIEADALRRSGVPGWGNFIDKEIQGGGPLIDLGIHMLDTTMYLLDFPEINRIQAYSFQKIGPYKSEGTFGTWDPGKYTVEDSLFGTIELKNGCVIRLNTSFALNMKEENRYNISLHGDKAGATLYPLEIYTDKAGKLEYLSQNKLSPVDKHTQSMKHFVDVVLSDQPHSSIEAEQGYHIQKMIELLYKSAETGEALIYEDY
ncbi:Gfo/Idh/MocA family protein [Streptococcus uberis]|uniref:Gfo/Idh/MocA family protein n=1 Tax=Streptococcus uberis TaxID=1349 RepID=UPI003892B46B